jgi:hypothetical protein
MSFGNPIALSFESFSLMATPCPHITKYHKMIKIATPLRGIDSIYVIH